MRIWSHSFGFPAIQGPRGAHDQRGRLGAAGGQECIMDVHELEQAQMFFVLMSRIVCTYCVLAVAVVQAHLHNVHPDVNQGKRCMGCVTCRCGPSASRALSTNLLIGLRSLLVVPQLVSRIVKLPSTSAASVTCTDTYLTCTCRCRRLDAAMAWLSRIQFNLLETKLPPLDSRFKDFCANKISIGR